MQNVQSNASLSRGKIKLQEKSISPKELSLESLSFSPGDLLKHQMLPGISQLLWVKSQLLWSVCLPFPGWNFDETTYGNGDQLSHSLSVIGFWAVFRWGGGDFRCFTFKAFDLFLTTASINDKNYDQCMKKMVLTITAEDARPSIWTQANNISPGLWKTCSTISTGIFITSRKLAEFSSVEFRAFTIPIFFITCKFKLKQQQKKYKYRNALKTSRIGFTLTENLWHLTYGCNRCLYFY